GAVSAIVPSSAWNRRGYLRAAARDGSVRLPRLPDVHNSLMVGLSTRHHVRSPRYRIMAITIGCLNLNRHAKPPRRYFGTGHYDNSGSAHWRLFYCFHEGRIWWRFRHHRHAFSIDGNGPANGGCVAGPALRCDGYFRAALLGGFDLVEA